MEFKNYLSIAKDKKGVLSQITQHLGEEYDLGFLFTTHISPDEIGSLIKEIQKKINIKNIVGCTGAGIIGTESEVEYQLAHSLVLAKLPEVKIVPFYLTQAQLDQLNKPEDWYNFFEVYPNENPIFLAFPDPFSINMNQVLLALNTIYPKSPVIGGLASGSAEPNGNTLVLNGQIYHEGLVGAVLTGNVEVKTIVSQGCKPIGQSYIVTKSQANLIFELGGKSFIQTLEDVITNLSSADRALAQEAIFVGIAMNEAKSNFKRGDFIVRGLLGIDQQTGAGAIGDYVKPGQTIQFHLRDAQTATDDLNDLLIEYHNPHSPKPTGALLFSCNGRGENLFKQKNHDLSILQHHVGPVPTAGFFCAGEIGPIGGSNFLHGFTDSIALFYPKSGKK